MALCTHLSQLETAISLSTISAYLGLNLASYYTEDVLSITCVMIGAPPCFMYL